MWLFLIVVTLSFLLAVLIVGLCMWRGRLQGNHKE